MERLSKKAYLGSDSIFFEVECLDYLLGIAPFSFL